MMYAWFSISKGCLNYANRLIERETDKLLGLSGERKIYSIFEYLSDKDIADINNNCSFVIIPGCTTLHDSTKGLDLTPQEIMNDPRRGYKATTRLKDIEVPIYNIGGAFGSNDPTTKVAQYIKQPVGVRDPFTHSFLTENHIKSIFIGCPTLFLGNATKWNYSDGPIIFNFGAGSVGEQVELLNKLNKKYSDITIVLQEKDQSNIIDKYNIKNKCVPYDDIDKILTLYRRAKCVITGRLHAALPSITLGTPVIFIKTHDSKRFSLLEDLGLPLIETFDIDNILSQLNNIDNKKFIRDVIFNRIEELKKRYLDYIIFVKQIIDNKGERCQK